MRGPGVTGRAIARAVLGIGAVLCCVLGGAAGAAAQELVIGVIAPLTGSKAEQGMQFKEGAELAVADLNKAGGLLGRQVRVELLDDEGLAVLLEPYAGHRHRVQRLVELSGLSLPRRGPRMAPRSHLPG